ncbi:MAG: hypothetical protein ACYC8V_06930 [Caulobacteraceae bacterium]
MGERLDLLIERLATAPPDRGLAGFGDEVVRRRREARVAAALAPVRLASVGVALAIGFISGSAMASRSAAAVRPPTLLDATANLSPSMLIEGSR